MNISPGRIPSLDGLRGVSILFVVIGHSAHTMPWLPIWSAPLVAIAGNAALGVSIFFAISGFLITHLLLKEEAGNGAIDVRAFYTRRIFRILPAFYTYCAVAGILSVLGVISFTRIDLIAACLFLWNYWPGTSSWWLGHTWSLSIEEQFYLLWPLTLVLFGRSRARWISLALIATAPLIRVAVYALEPAQRGYISIMLHTRADALMFGCVLALWNGSDALVAIQRRVLRTTIVVGSAVFLFFISPVLQMKWKGAYMLPLGYTLEGLCIGILLLSVIRNPGSLGGRILNSKGFVWIGVISYSLYLWNPLFLGPTTLPGLGVFPANVVAAFAAASLSYYCVEQPFQQMRGRLLRRKSPAQKTQISTVSVIP